MTLSKTKTILIFMFLTLTTVVVLNNSKVVITSTISGLEIWKNAIFPSLFAFFIIADLLIYYGYANLLGYVFQPLTRFLFRLGGNSAFVFIVSMFSGFPSGARYTKEMYCKGLITLEEANNLIMICHFSNPLFILGAISSTFLKRPDIGIYILIIHFLCNFIIGILFRYRIKNKQSINKIKLRKAFSEMHQIRIRKELKFGTILSKAIINAINLLLLVLGILIIFITITNLFTLYFPLKPVLKGAFSGLLEMSQGCYNTQFLALTLKQKTMLCLTFISFGGLSVHTQVLALISDTKIKYYNFFIARCIHAFLAIIICLFTFDLFF